MIPRHQRQPTNTGRRGGTIHEAMMATAIASVVLVSVTQLVAMIARKHLAYERRTLATLEAGNVMEQLMSWRWAELTPDKLAALRLSDECRQRLPDARLRVQTTTDGQADGGRRIDVQIDWRNEANRQGEPIRLVAWRYRNEEAGP
jgi:hypothetical protein